MAPTIRGLVARTALGTRLERAILFLALAGAGTSCAGGAGGSGGSTSSFMRSHSYSSEATLSVSAMSADITAAMNAAG